MEEGWSLFCPSKEGEPMNKNTTEKLKAISTAYEKLLAQLEAKETEYVVRGSYATSTRAQARLSKLAKEIESLKTRIERCERLQEQTLSE